MFTTHFGTFDSNLHLALKIMNFEDMSLTQKNHFLVKSMDAQYK
jgi:hypothetical protein